MAPVTRSLAPLAPGHRRAPWRRRRTVGASLAGLAVVTAATVAGISRSTAAVPRAAAAAAVTVDDTAYPVPSDAIVVATNGSDTAAGTLRAPYATIAHALGVAPSGATVVVRAGTYHESLGAVTRRVTLQAYPHEQVWVDGSVVVRGFVHDTSTTWTRSNWSTTLCRSCHPASLLTAANPAAGLPDQVFVDGVALSQVTTRAAVRAGTFFVDPLRHELVLGSDPAAHTVEATVEERALQLNGPAAAGSIVRGIGIRRFAPRYSMDVPAAVVVNTSDVLFEHNTIEWSASRGLTVLGAHTLVLDNTFAHTGINAIHGHQADWIVIARNHVTDANEQRWSIAPSMQAQIAGVKLTSTHHGVVRDNEFVANHCNGIWFDVASYDATIVANTITDNDGIGIEFEASARAIVAGNVIAANGKAGVKISGSNRVDLINNSIAANAGPQIGVYDDPARNTDPARLALGITLDTAAVRIIGNVVAAPTGSQAPLLESYDATRPRHLSSADMISVDDHNLWTRPSSASPLEAVVWQPDLLTNSHWASVSAFRAASGRESASIVSDTTSLAEVFADPGTGDWRVRSDGPAAAPTADLSATVAAALGIAAQGPHYGAPPITDPVVPTTTVDPTTTTPTTTTPPTTAPPTTAPPTTTVPPATTTSTPPPALVEIHELRRARDGDRLYLPLGAMATARIAQGYTDTGALFRAYAADTGTGVVAVQLRGANGHHLVTTFANEAAGLRAKGWVDEGPAFRCVTKASTGVLAVFRPWDKSQRTHRLSFTAAVGAGPVGPRLCYVER